MADKKVILVTGVSDYWGTNIASRLLEKFESLEEQDYSVIGLDSEPPSVEIKGLDFIQADIRNPLLVDLLKSEHVNTLCHLAFLESVRNSEAAFDYNVMGTMKLLGACSEAGVRKVILKSSTSVYGAYPTNPAFITEEHPVQGSRDYGYNRNLVEIEAFCNGFRRQVPEMILTILRFVNIVGPKADTPMTRFLKEPFAPVLIGFDPLMQMVHELDVLDALLFAIQNDVPGAYNYAADGILPLSRVIALAGKIPFPVFHPFAYLGVGITQNMRFPTTKYWPIELDFLRYSCVVDTQKMHNELSISPRYTAEEALREFAGDQRLRRYMPERSALAYDEERLRDTMERRKRVREQALDENHL